MPMHYDLTKMAPDSFEQMVNTLALHALGAGVTGFGPGADGGRDGYFEGDAPYPSETERWSGIWYLQSKYHCPHLSTDAQKWLLERISKELYEFSREDSKRTWPHNWIVATNIDPSGTPETGTFDKARKLVSEARPALAGRFHIWGGSKIQDLLTKYPNVAKRFGHFITPGHILDHVYQSLNDDRASIDTIIYFLIAKQFRDQRHTKLEQAGSQGDTRPGIHDLFIDLPFICKDHNYKGMALRDLTVASCGTHRIDPFVVDSPRWHKWKRHPKRSNVWFVRGGPGQGKSTLGQYFCQIHRAALILDNSAHIKVQHAERQIAHEVQSAAIAAGCWPLVPRIPIHIELKDYAQWFGKRANDKPKGILSYLSDRLLLSVEQPVPVGTLRRAMSCGNWFVVFDGLDEVPHDVKDNVAQEVINFVNGVAAEVDSDLLTLCTSRPQGYSGQFSELNCPIIDLAPLNRDQALRCARPVICFQREKEEGERNVAILEAASESSAVKELMTTPLQSHILAVVVRDGERPPERRWRLYDRFYDVIRRREANRNLPDLRLARLLREDEKLLKTLHNRVGFALHASAETSAGAETSLERAAFRSIATQAVAQMIDEGAEEKIELLDQATIERLVLLNTPEDSKHLRFDIRQLQEFFAAEFLYETVEVEELRERIAVIAGDAHWREVLHFLISAIIEQDRNTELSVAIDELAKLNCHENDSFDLELARRMGKGSLVVARILREGVLEQDKGVRQRFRDCLSPMASFAAPQRLMTLATVEQENSKHWLWNFLLDQLKVLSHAENIGAAIVLTAVLPDAHPRLSELTEFLSEASPQYVSHVLNSRKFFTSYSTNHELGTTTPQWLMHLLFNFLSSDYWHELQDDGLHYALSVFEQASLSSSEAIAGDQRQHLRPLLWLAVEAYRDDDENITETQVAENIRIHRSYSLLEHNAPKLKAIILELEQYQLSGFMRVIFLMAKYAVSQLRSDYLNLLAVLHEASSLDTFLPFLATRIGFALPVHILNSPKCAIETISSLNDSDFKSIYYNEHFGDKFRFSRASVSFIMPPTINDLNQLIEISPASLLEKLVGSRSFAPPFSDDISAMFYDERENLIWSVVSRYPEDESVRAFCWDLLRFEATTSERVRIAAIQMANTGLPYTRSSRSNNGFGGWHNEPSDSDTIQLTLPKEAAALPLIADDLIVRRLIFKHHFSRTKHSSNESGNLQHDVSILVPIAEDLRSVFNDYSLCDSVRGAAALLLLIHKDGGLSTLEYTETFFLSKCKEPSFSWLLDDLAHILTTGWRQDNAKLRMFVKSLFRSCRHNYVVRSMLENILHVWLETANAPVTSTGLKETWLARTR